MSICIFIHLSVFCRIHTAVKIAPKYTQPTIHVFDASKSVVVVCVTAVLICIRACTA